jgi:hypothetical protein
VTGRYAVQGVQLRAGVQLWAARAGARLLIEDDRSFPQCAVEVHARVVARGCAFVLGPYGGDCARAGRTGGRWGGGLESRWRR